MERMGDILARNATRRARLRSATGGRRAPATSAGAPQTKAPQQPPAGKPPADVLPADRILELPRRTSKGAGRAETSTAPADAAQPTALAAGEDVRHLEAVPGGIATPRRAAAPAALRPAPAASRAMTPLREVAQAYLAKRPQQAGSDAAPEVARTVGRSGTAKKPPSTGSAPDVCPHCGGAGYIRLDVPIGDPSFGQAVPCECKEQQKEERRRSDLRRLSSLDPFVDKTFDTFDTAVPGVQEALCVARDYAADPQGWLVLMGGYGAGKTHLAAAIANQRLAAGSPVFFSIVPDLLDHLRAAFAPSSEMPYDEMFDKVREAELLVLDDLGAENSTAWATEKLFQLVNYRYNFRMPTVITTNHRLLERMDERIHSRLSDLSLVRRVVIEAADYRERRAGRAPRANGGSQRGRGYSR